MELDERKKSERNCRGTELYGHLLRIGIYELFSSGWGDIDVIVKKRG